MCGADPHTGLPQAPPVLWVPPVSLASSPYLQVLGEREWEGSHWGSADCVNGPHGSVVFLILAIIPILLTQSLS